MFQDWTKYCNLYEAQFGGKGRQEGVTAMEENIPFWHSSATNNLPPAPHRSSPRCLESDPPGWFTLTRPTFLDTGYRSGSSRASGRIALSVWDPVAKIMTSLNPNTTHSLICWWSRGYGLIGNAICLERRKWGFSQAGVKGPPWDNVKHASSEIIPFSGSYHLFTTKWCA